ncbi:MAG TPA: hypothetical protein VGF44_15480 [Terriglobales bacterium]|jgi:hypothetical protein
MAQTSQTIRKGETPIQLWWSLIAGFVAFGGDLGISYVLQQHACSSADFYLLHVVTWIAFVTAISGFVMGWRIFRMLPESVTERGRESHDRAHFQALLGMGFSLFFALAIVANGVPRWILDPCS